MSKPDTRKPYEPPTLRKLSPEQAAAILCAENIIDETTAKKASEAMSPELCDPE